MQISQPSIDYISYVDVTSNYILESLIYSNMHKNYYWSDNFSAKNYIALAKAGFISVTEKYKGKEFLIPEIQYRYALLDFKDLHISKKVKKILNQKTFDLEFSDELDEVFEAINSFHKNSWLTPKYLNTLKETQKFKSIFKVKSVLLKENGNLLAGEIGYIIGKTYTSLSGFSSREKHHRNYGTVQLVLLAKYLENKNFDFWNLGHPFMDYKLVLGAKVYERKDFLKRWKESILK